MGMRFLLAHCPLLIIIGIMGKKIGINKLNNKKYILFDENNENTLKSYSATTLKFVKEPQLLQLSNKIMKKKAAIFTQKS